MIQIGDKVTYTDATNTKCPNVDLLVNAVYEIKGNTYLLTSTVDPCLTPITEAKYDTPEFNKYIWDDQGKGENLTEEALKLIESKLAELNIFLHQNPLTLTISGDIPVEREREMVEVSYFDEHVGRNGGEEIVFRGFKIAELEFHGAILILLGEAENDFFVKFESSSNVGKISLLSNEEFHEIRPILEEQDFTFPNN